MDSLDHPPHEEPPGAGCRRGRADTQGQGPPPPRRRFSEVLSDIGCDPSLETVTVGDLLRLMEGRGRAALIFLFALPNVLPTPPGTSAVLGIPLLYLSYQMMLGRLPWLPRFVSERGVSRTAFVGMVDRARPFIGRAERYLRPRWPAVVGHAAERPIGALCLILAIVLALPIPLGNMPPAFAISLMALGVLERDGICAAIGAAVGVFALGLSAAVVGIMAKAALFVVLGAFG